jgi:hypothetical protein
MLGALDISSLGGFVAAAKNDNHYAPAAGEVQTIPRPYVNAHLGYVTSHWSPVSEIAGFSKAKTCSNSDLCPFVPKSVKPGLELFRLTDDEHRSSVSDRIRMSSGMRILGR